MTFAKRTTRHTVRRLRSFQPSRQLRLTVRILVVIISLLPSLLMAKAYLTTFSTASEGPGPFADAVTYLAAGERLNAGHDLYRFGPGDRPLFVYPPTSTAALLSPPPIAAPWRILSAIPFGITLWVIAAWIALLGTMAYLVFRIGWPAAVACAAFYPAVGEQLAVANVAAFFPGLLVASWRFRDHPKSGVATGAMAVLKLAPATMLGWLLGRHRKGLIWAAAAILALILMGVVAAGPGSYAEYLSVATASISSPFSLSAQLGIPGLSLTILAVGFGAGALIRSESLAFAFAIVASVAGNPALYGAGLVPLLAILAPLIPEHPRYFELRTDA